MSPTNLRRRASVRWASVDPSAAVGEGAYIGAYAVIEQGVKTGKNCKIYPQVYLGDGVRLGDNVTLYPGVRITKPALSATM